MPLNPARIISLVPSQTELLHDLGLGDRVCGITKFCVHPETWFRSKTRVGGTKNVHMDAVQKLRPDLILANKEENTEQDIDALSKEYPLWVSDIKTLADALSMIHEIGMFTQTRDRADALCREISAGFHTLSTAGFERKRALYLIWKNPFMAAGRDTFINHMLDFAGFDNAIADPRSRYPELTTDDIHELAPAVILLSSEPFPFRGRHVTEVRQLFPEAIVHEADGELFSWYGSRLLRSPRYFMDLRTKI